MRYSDLLSAQTNDSAISIHSYELLVINKSNYQPKPCVQH
jgi:hypothetical protein